MSEISKAQGNWPRQEYGARPRTDRSIIGGEITVLDSYQVVRNYHDEVRVS
jgi:hypothetical protein